MYLADRGCVPEEQSVVAWVKSGLGCFCVRLDQALVQFQLQWSRLDQSFGCSWFLATNTSVLLVLAQAPGLSFSLVSTEGITTEPQATLLDVLENSYWDRFSGQMAGRTRVTLFSFS